MLGTSPGRGSRTDSEDFFEKEGRRTLRDDLVGRHDGALVAGREDCCQPLFLSGARSEPVEMRREARV